VTEYGVAETPAAETGIVKVELLALLVITTLPLTVSTCEGEKETSSVALWPAAMAAPVTPRLMVRLAPVGVTAETVKLEVPVFLSATESISDLPTVVTLPKFVGRMC
jgi:hypothetical protein